jgi:hypothetical protein
MHLDFPGTVATLIRAPLELAKSKPFRLKLHNMRIPTVATLTPSTYELPKSKIRSHFVNFGSSYKACDTPP